MKHLSSAGLFLYPNTFAETSCMRLVKLAISTGCTYSRYADDLTFSTNKKEFPEKIAMPAGPDGLDAHRWLPGDALQDVITRSGFSINAKKTRFMSPITDTFSVSRAEKTDATSDGTREATRARYFDAPQEWKRVPPSMISGFGGVPKTPACFRTATHCSSSSRFQNSR